MESPRLVLFLEQLTQQRGYSLHTNQRTYMPKPARASSKPVHKIRHGAISASIWRKDTDKGPLHNVTLQRAYRDGEDWKNTNSFGRKDLLVVGFIAARAYEWIASQQGKTRPSSRAEQPADDVPY
jgi:hypothetical protein